MSDDPAKARFFVIQIVRWVGIAMVIVGVLVIAGRADLGLPREAGYALFLAGVIDALFVPTLLARRWKSPPQ